MYNLPVCIPIQVRSMYPDRCARCGRPREQHSDSQIQLSTYDQVYTVSSQRLLVVTVKLTTRTYVRTMPRQLSLYARQHAKEIMAQGASMKETMECLHKEGIFPYRQTVWRFMRHYNKHGSIEPLQSSGRPTKLTDEVLQVIETAMQEEDETTAREISV